MFRLSTVVRSAAPRQGKENLQKIFSQIVSTDPELSSEVAKLKVSLDNWNKANPLGHMKGRETTKADFELFKSKIQAPAGVPHPVDQAKARYEKAMEVFSNNYTLPSHVDSKNLESVLKGLLTVKPFDAKGDKELEAVYGALTKSSASVAAFILEVNSTFNNLNKRLGDHSALLDRQLAEVSKELKKWQEESNFIFGMTLESANKHPTFGPLMADSKKADFFHLE